MVKAIFDRSLGVTFAHHLENKEFPNELMRDTNISRGRLRLNEIESDTARLRHKPSNNILDDKVKMG
jgi:hypothetical protein